MKQHHDLGLLVMAAVLLLLCVSYMTQCSSTSDRSEPIVAATPSANPPPEVRAERERKAKSVREMAAEEEKEEREKLKSVSRALKTMGANPELRATYGLPE